MRSIKSAHGQSTVEYIALVTVVLIALFVVLNGKFKTAIDNTFNNAANAVESVGAALGNQVQSGAGGGSGGEPDGNTGG